MAFKLALTPTYQTKIIVELPAEKGGFEQSTFKAEFKRCDSEDIEELRKLPGKEVLERVLRGWSELVDEDNQPVPFNGDTLKAVLNIPQAATALAEGFWTSIFKAREKN